MYSGIRYIYKHFDHNVEQATMTLYRKLILFYTYQQRLLIQKYEPKAAKIKLEAESQTMIQMDNSDSKIDSYVSTHIVRTNKLPIEMIGWIEPLFIF